MVASFGVMAGCHFWLPCHGGMLLPGVVHGGVPFLGAMLGCHCWVPWWGAIAGCYGGVPLRFVGVPFLGAMAGCHVVVLFVLLAGAMVAQLETK